MRCTLITVAFLGFLPGCSNDDGQPIWIESVDEVPSPGAVGSRYPHLAGHTDDARIVSWLQPVDGGDHELWFATWQGSSWSDARRVATGGNWFINWADFPSVVPGDDGLLAAHWLQQRPEHVYAYEVRTAVSVDAGRSWSLPLTPHDDDTPTEHGFVSLLPQASGMLAVWLDGRHTTGGHGHDHDSVGAMSLRAATIDRDGRLDGRGAELDGRVCDCCQTDAALTRDGPVVVYRDRSPAEVRDIGIVRWTAGGWSEPRLVHEDGWRVSACPVNGPAVDAEDDEVVVAWFTAPDRPRVRVAFSSDGGQSFSTPVDVAIGSVAGRVDVVLLEDGRAVVSWLRETPDGAEVVAQPFTRRGAAAPPVLVARSSAARATGFPQVIRAGDQLLFAWTDAGDPPRIRTAVARLR